VILALWSRTKLAEDIAVTAIRLERIYGAGLLVLATVLLSLR
jgi:hypothetical protein